MSKYLNDIWKLELGSNAVKQLSKLDQQNQIMILKYFKKNILNLKNPRTKGKALVGNLAGHWRYRVGDFRILTQIRDDEFIIIAVSIGHRREIYKK